LARWRLCRLCGLGLPGLAGPFPSSEKHRGRSLTLDRTRRSREGQSASWARFLENLHPVDWFVSVACLERSRAAWDYLFALRASRADCLLVDALRARAVRLYPRNEERQDSAVAEFWGYLLAGERPGSLPILGLRLRYRLSQRQVASLLGVHEGNISRQTTKLRDHCLDEISQRLLEQGWTGDDLSEFVLKEMDSLLMDEPRLSADHLAALL